VLFSSSHPVNRFLDKDDEEEGEGLRERFVRAVNYALNTGVLSDVVQVQLTECKNFLPRNILDDGVLDM